MANYRDNRSLADKLDEHRHWNTLEFEYSSAAIEIFDQFDTALNLLTQFLPVSFESLTRSFAIARVESNLVACNGLIRLLVFSADETPNRFKAVFPAYLVESDMATPENGSISWPGYHRSLPSTLPIERLAKIIVSSTESRSNVAIKDFCQWAVSREAIQVIRELASGNFKYTLSRLASRLAQGADTNRRGHGATDFIKSRLREWGFSPELGNTNACDVPVSTIVDSYIGPRKYDTLIWDIYGSLAVISQSQLYMSDVGSIQGKTIEEDAVPIEALRKKYPDVVVLTHTEGFGCHTSMRSRLTHVLQSPILDGFIQFKTLDVKLRRILKAARCYTVQDFDNVIVNHARRNISVEETLKLFCAQMGIRGKEASESVKNHFQKLIEAQYYQLKGEMVSISHDREVLVHYYRILDNLVATATNKRPTSNAIAIGGTPEPAYSNVNSLEQYLYEIPRELQESIRNMIFERGGCRSLD